jgi:hypothetical protein
MTRERYLLHVRATAATTAVARASAPTSIARRLPAALAALALIAPGLALAAKPDSAVLAAASPCCDDPSRFRYDALPSEGSVDFAVDRGSPLFEFQSGRSFFHAFRLPDGGRPYVVELRSYLDRPDSPRTARVFYPVVAILTDDFLVARATDLDALRFDLPVLEQTTTPAYRLQLPFDPSKTRERYLVVFTPEPLLAPRAVDASTPDAAEQASRTAYLGASAFGRLRITVRPLPSGATPAESAPDAEAPASQPGTNAPTQPGG